LSSVETVELVLNYLGRQSHYTGIYRTFFYIENKVLLWFSHRGTSYIQWRIFSSDGQIQIMI